MNTPAPREPFRKLTYKVRRLARRIEGNPAVAVLTAVAAGFLAGLILRGPGRKRRE